LLADGGEVICVDNLVTGSRANVAHLVDDDRFEFYEQDVTVPIEVNGHVDFVLHFASPASPIQFDDLSLEIMAVNSKGTEQALEVAKHNDAGFLVASTSETYGDPKVHPQTEDYWGNVNPVGRRSVYDESKRFGEAITMAYHREFGLNTHIVRIFNTYGPRMRADDGRAVPAFINQALANEDVTIFGDGSQTRSFQYITDLVDGVVRLMATDEPTPVNLGNPAEEHSVKTLAETIIRLTNSTSKLTTGPLPPDDPKIRRPSMNKALRVLSWEPKIDLETGLTSTIKYFQEEA
jgi:dTDP-glucose 4,6-dehydratase